MKEGRTHLAHKPEHGSIWTGGGDADDATALDMTLSEGIAAAWQIGREAEHRPDANPKVNDSGIEELVERVPAVESMRTKQIHRLENTNVIDITESDGCTWSA